MTRWPNSASWQDALGNIIKLPNISASVQQLKASIKELQSQGYDLPDYRRPQTMTRRDECP